jgi:hypothetical protein
MSIGVQGKARDNRNNADRLKLTASRAPSQQVHLLEIAAAQSPERSFLITPDLPSTTGGDICFRANTLPARKVEFPQAARRGSPDDSIPTMRKTPYGSREGGEVSAVVRDPSVVQKAEAAEGITDPETAGWKGKQTENVHRKQFIAEGRVEQLEPSAVKTIQSDGSSEPQKSVGSLR